MTRTPDDTLTAFVERVLAEGAAHHRDFPWRRTRDPYAVLVSEVMLQQTQVARVGPRYERWLELFPTLETLAAAPLTAVLREWQGLGYNRRAVSLKTAAELVVSQNAGPGPASLPRDESALRALPGVGAATAAGVRAFAFGEQADYLETNVRAVFLHELFGERDGVRDREILPLVRRTAELAAAGGVDARTWNLALLDYGAHLKRTRPNPSRRSAHHTRQSPFQGSRRQKRARLLRAVLADPGSSGEELASTLGLDVVLVEEILDGLADEGFLRCVDGRWRVADR